MARKPIPLPETHETPVKATDAEITRRVSAVHKLLVAGVGRASILQHAAENWQVSERMADEYIARARAVLNDQTDRDKESNLSMAIARMNAIYQQCYAAKNYKGAITAQVEINKLLGLYAPTKNEHTGANGAPIDHIFRIVWTDEDDNGGHS